MQAGDVLNGYTILEDFKVVGAGLSKWTFAERDGREYFIKEFLSPTYPDEYAPGSERTKARKRARCAVFEDHHRGIQQALAPVSTYGGNLIVTLDFFRWGAKYYKVTEKVDVAGLTPPDIAALGFADQLVLLKTVAFSLKILHDLRIVHSDLKPSNVLIKRTELGYTTKLIDFDSAYLVGSPPPPDEIVGTLNFYSPELVGYIQESGVEAHQLTQKSDIFSLGLIYAELLTGAPPPFDAARHVYASVAARAGEVLRMPAVAEIPPAVIELVDRMLLLDPAARPSVGEVHATLMKVRPAAPTSARPVAPAAATAPAAAAGGSRLKGKGLRAVTGDTPTASPSPAATATGTARRLLGKLITRVKDPGAR